MKKIFALMLVQVTGCATLSADGEAVRIVYQKSYVQDCKYLGEVEAAPPYGVPTDWKVKLRNKAADLGANHVLTSTETPGVQFTVKGKAYLCLK